MFIAVSYWNSRKYIFDVDVTNLKPQLRSESLDATQCGSVVFYDHMLQYTLHCPTAGATGRYVVLQSNSEIEHLLLLFEVMIYGYGKALEFFKQIMKSVILDEW